MLTDILKVIELLIKAVGDRHSPSSKRNKLGKSLANVHARLVKIIENGNQILAAVKNDRWRVSTDLLQEQCEQLMSLHETLMTDDLRSILLVQLPECKHINVYLNWKELSISMRLLALFGNGTSDGQWSAITEPTKKGDMSFSIFNGWNESKWVVRGDDIFTYDAQMWRDEGDIEAATAVLTELSAITERLRLFLKNEFEIEELI